MKSPPFTSVTRWLTVVVGCAVLAMAQPMSLSAADTPPASPPADAIIYPKNSAERPAIAGPAAEKPSDFGRSLSVVVAFLLAGAGAWVLIQRRNAGLLPARGARKLQIEETKTLGNRQYLVVASYEGRRLLLGVTPGQIQLLTPLENDPNAGEKKP